MKQREYARNKDFSGVEIAPVLKISYINTVMTYSKLNCIGMSIFTST